LIHYSAVQFFYVTPLCTSCYELYKDIYDSANTGHSTYSVERMGTETTKDSTAD